MQGDADFTIHLDLELNGSHDTQFVSLLKIALPGASIPFIGTFGPALNFGTRMQLATNVASQIDIHVSSRMDGIHFSFPPGSGDNSAQADTNNNTNSESLMVKLYLTVLSMTFQLFSYQRLMQDSICKAQSTPRLFLEYVYLFTSRFLLSLSLSHSLRLVLTRRWPRRFSSSMLKWGPSLP